MSSAFSVYGDNMRKIIDVSEHQKEIDWVKVKQETDGVILRIGYGDDDSTQDDKCFLYNISECERLGIPYEVYLYSYADSDAHIQSEIAHIKRLLGGRNVRVWLDLEYRPAQKYWRKAVEAFLKAFPDGGVYSWEWVFTDILDGIDCPRWICAYGSNSGKPEADYKPVLSCHGWQYTSKTRVPGINGDVDMSEWYGDFAEAIQKPTAWREAVVAKISSWEGYNERSGQHKAIIDGYNAYLPTAVKAGCANYSMKYTDEWCATCASYAYIACGLGYMFPVECSCPRMITLAQKMGIWQENDGYVPSIADTVLYDWDDSGKGDNTGTADHIGIVIAVNRDTFVVMEGNNGESVRRRTMSVNGKYIRGFITPKFSDNDTVKETVNKKVYEVSKTGTPNKSVCVKWGLLKNNQKVTPRLQPDESAKPCSFAPVQPLTRIDVYDYITTAKRWAYCRVNGKYGFILASSISAYLRTPKQSIDKVVDWVLTDDFGTLETRRKALTALGYDYDTVQNAVTERVRPSGSASVRLYAPRFWDNNPEYFGDETIFIDGKQGAVFDTGMHGSLAVSKVKALNLDSIAIILTHPHADHTGCTRDMIDALPVRHVYLPNVDGIRKYQKSYAERMDGIAEHCKKHDVAVTRLKMGDSFAVGSLAVSCVFQADADKLSEHDNHHFVNNMSMVYRVTIGSWRILIGGDLSAEGILQMMSKGVDYSCDVLKFFWHGDRGGIKTAFANSLKGVQIAYTQYEKKEGKGNGRADTYNLLRNVGAFVARAYEDGEISIDFHGATAKLTTSLGVTRTFVKRQTAYKVSLTTKAKSDKGSGLLAIEPADYSVAEVQALKKAGYTVLAYLSVGSVSDERPYYKQLEKYTLRRLDGWEHERYLDVCETAVQEWAVNQGMKFLNAGYDGLWIDNLDVYEEYPSDSAYKGITRILSALYPHGYIMINGGVEYVSKAIANHARIAHGVTQEEVFSRIVDYSGSGTFGAQTGAQSRAYQKYIATALSNGMDAYLLEYTRDSKIKDKIVQYGTASGAGYYISEDVDL